MGANVGGNITNKKDWKEKYIRWDPFLTYSFINITSLDLSVIWPLLFFSFNLYFKILFIPIPILDVFILSFLNFFITRRAVSKVSF